MIYVALGMGLIALIIPHIGMATGADPNGPLGWLFWSVLGGALFAFVVGVAGLVLG